MKLHTFDDTVEEKFQEYWAPIVMPDGVWDLEQVKRELYDYAQIIRSVSEVYDELTVGRISKPNTDPIHVIDAVREAQHEEIQESIREAITTAREDQ